MNILDLSGLPDWLKLGTKHFVAVALATGFVLLAPESWISALGLHAVSNQLEPWIGAAFVLSSAMALVRAVAAVGGWSRKKYRKRELRKQRIDRLHRLTPSEKKILRGYLKNRTRTQQLNVMDGDVRSLVNAGIIHQASALGELRTGWAFNIREWAWDYLHQNPELLDPQLRGPLPKDRG